ncbi:MAG: hypothetical protein SWZ49_33875, partial [Cyanobacteriota bacterium]|nr:hypothetical protein [Cyanobacteriota bacterium]
LKILVSRVQVSFLAYKMKPPPANASGGFLIPQKPRFSDLRRCKCGVKNSHVGHIWIWLAKFWG